MLCDDIKKLLNTVFDKGKIPLHIDELFLYRPTFHEQPFEDFEPINEKKRLIICDPLHINFTIRYEDHRYQYLLKCRNERGRFKLEFHHLLGADLYPGEDPKALQKRMKQPASAVFNVLLMVLNLFASDES